MNLFMSIIYHFNKEEKVIFVSASRKRFFHSNVSFAHNSKWRNDGKECQVIHIINILSVDNLKQIFHKTKHTQKDAFDVHC